MSSGKVIGVLWFGRISMLFVTIISLYCGYGWGFVRNDIMQMTMHFTVALTLGTMFFLTFPIFGMHTRFNHLEKQLYTKSDFNKNSTLESSNKKTVIYMILAIVFTIVFDGFNFVLADISYSNSDNLRFFLHMVIIIATTLAFLAILLTLTINGIFTQLELLISEWESDKSAEEKSEAKNRE